MSFEDMICHSIEIIAKKLVADATYDKTIEANIASSKDDNGQYNVKYGDITFKATPAGGADYNINDRVFILIPQNNMQKTKVILCKV